MVGLILALMIAARTDYGVARIQRPGTIREITEKINGGFASIAGNDDVPQPDFRLDSHWGNNFLSGGDHAGGKPEWSAQFFKALRSNARRIPPANKVYETRLYVHALIALCYG